MCSALVEPNLLSLTRMQLLDLPEELITLIFTFLDDKSVVVRPPPPLSYVLLFFVYLFIFFLLVPPPRNIHSVHLGLEVMWLWLLLTLL